MFQDEFLYVEKPALDQLQKDKNWSYKDGRELNPDNSNVRSSLKDVILTPNLQEAIKRINPWISEDNLRKVVSDFTKVQFSNLVEANKSIWNAYLRLR